LIAADAFTASCSRLLDDSIPANVKRGYFPLATMSKNHADSLRKELLNLAEAYVTSRKLESRIYRSIGKKPTVLFYEYESNKSKCHGNFHPETYAVICDHSSWAMRLKKAHTGKNRGWFRNEEAVNARELDSCTSSDALAMNVFCHPSSKTNKVLSQLFGYQQLPVPDFGFKAKLPFATGGIEPTSSEIDIRLYTPNRTLLAECKLTEASFNAAPRSKVERYAAFTETFDVERLPQKNDQFLHYQLIRNVLAARYHEANFVLICDRRRPDLMQAFADVTSLVVDQQLRQRCSVITWQQITSTMPADVQSFLADKYGIK
jgi:hypothetical protein